MKMPRRPASQRGNETNIPEMTLPETPGSDDKPLCSISTRDLLEGRFSAHQLAVLLALQAKTAPSQAELAFMAGTSVPTVAKAIRELEAMGEVVVITRWAPNRRGRLSNAYLHPSQT